MVGLFYGVGPNKNFFLDTPLVINAFFSKRQRDDNEKQNCVCATGDWVFFSLLRRRPWRTRNYGGNTSPRGEGAAAVHRRVGGVYFTDALADLPADPPELRLRQRGGASLSF